MKKRLFLIFVVVCLALAACSAGKFGEGGTSVPDASTPGVSSPAQTTKAHTAPSATASAPVQTTPATSPPDTFRQPEKGLPVLEAFAAYRPDCVLKEIVETEAGHFLFYIENKAPHLTQQPCERGVDFFDKQTGILANNTFPKQYANPKDSVQVPLTGYSLIDYTSVVLYIHDDMSIFWDSGHRGFPYVYKLTYENGELFWDYGVSSDPIFYPVAMDQFYMGYLSDESTPTRVLSACFASAGGFSLLFDLLDVIEPEFLMDFTTLPRVNFHYDAKNRQMLLTCPNILIDKGLTGTIPVPADDPYIQSAQLEPWGNGVRATLTLKPGAELYIPKATHIDRAPTRSPGVLFDLAFVSREALARYTSMYPAHIMEDITFICQEE